jgi:hypothetical protein
MAYSIPLYDIQCPKWKAGGNPIVNLSPGSFASKPEDLIVLSKEDLKNNIVLDNDGVTTIVLYYCPTPVSTLHCKTCRYKILGEHPLLNHFLFERIIDNPGDLLL